MLFSVLELLENCLCFSEDDKGGDDDPNNKDDKGDNKGEDNKGKNEDDTITLTKAEYENKLNQKFAEGARKAQEGKLSDKTPGLEKSNSKENSGNNSQSSNDEIKKIHDELAILKAEKIAGTLGVKSSYTEDLVALVRGKGLDLSEENLKKEAEKHPEWKVQNDGENGGGAKPLGSTSGKTTPPSPSEEEQANKLFGL